MSESGTATATADVDLAEEVTNFDDEDEDGSGSGSGEDEDEDEGEKAEKGSGGIMDDMDAFELACRAEESRISGGNNGGGGGGGASDSEDEDDDDDDVVKHGEEEEDDDADELLRKRKRPGEDPNSTEVIEEEINLEMEKLPAGPIGDQLAMLLKALSRDHSHGNGNGNGSGKGGGGGGFTPVIPPEVAAHVLAKVGCVSDNPSIPTLVSAVTQQFAMKLLYEIKNQRELRAAGAGSRLGRPPKRQKHKQQAPPLTLPDVAEGLALLSSRSCGRQRPGTYTD